MKRLLSLTLLSLSLFACKKEKIEQPTLTKVENTTVYLTYKESNGVDTENWFSGIEMKDISLPKINIKPDIQQGLLFGYYRKDGDYGIYSPQVFPVEYGQENWEHTPSPVTFKKATIPGYTLYEYPDGVPVQVITDAWNEGINPRDRITHPHDNEVFAFATADGKYKGLLLSKGTGVGYDHIVTEIWVAK